MNKKNIITIIKGSLIAIMITCILLFFLSIALAYTNLKEEVSTPIIIGTIAISIIIGSIISSKKVKRKGIINGGAVGAIYIITIYLISSIILGDFSFNMYSLITIAISIFMGILGGIIGVNS